MSSMNRVFILGRLGRDPKTRRTESGMTVCSFSVATSEFYKVKGGERQEKTEWHNIVTFNKVAENCDRYLGKGSQVCIEGRLQTDSWEDKKHGDKRYATKIMANNVRFIGRPDNENSKKEKNPNTGKEYTADDVPF